MAPLLSPGICLWKFVYEYRRYRAQVFTANSASEFGKLLGKV